jgi:carboxyl-terminal processing protease
MATSITWLKKSFLVGVLSASCFLVQAKPQVVPLDELKPDHQQRRTAVVIAQMLESYHYTRPDINDELSHSAFERYLDNLDINRSFFTQADLHQFDGFRDQFDDSFVSGHLTPAFNIFRVFRQKVEQRVAYAKQLLEGYSFDFTRGERYVFDRSDTAWPMNEKVLDELWRKRVKNDILAERLKQTGHTAEDHAAIKKLLHKRYDNLLHRVTQMDSTDVFQTFVNAFTLSIEPHTSYMSPRVSENFDIGMRLSLQGIGAVLRSESEYTQVMKTVVGGPAAKTGELHGGDRIVGVAQGEESEMEDVVGWRLQDVVDLIRGPKGSVVRLNILPKKAGPGGRTHEITIVRDEIKLEDRAANSQVIEVPEYPGFKIGVIDIPTFYRDFGAQAAGERNFRSTTRDVRQLLRELTQAKVNGVVVDLRQNGGGSLAEATELTGLFITQGPVVQVKDISGKIEVEKDTDPEQVYTGPLAVLVDRNSASASEIFAGAIQDYDRGLIIGEPTFGKGTVQTLVNIGRHLKSDDDMGRLRLTMAQFFRVQGASTQHRGVMPDILFPTAKGAAEHGERALDNAIPWASIKPAVPKPRLGVSLTGLRDRNQKRVAQDPGFQYLLAEEEEMMRVSDQRDISLHETERRAERERKEAEHLARRNQLRTHRGLPALKSLEDEEDLVLQDDEDVEGIKRIMLDESVRILIDYIHAQQPLTAQLTN